MSYAKPMSICRRTKYIRNGVLKLLINIISNKASGPENLKPRILKELATIIFLTSLMIGEVSSDLRNANISPVFKKD